jgi:hypothetical protein
VNLSDLVEKHEVMGSLGRSRPGIANHVPAGALVLSEGFVGALDNLRILLIYD